MNERILYLTLKKKWFDLIASGKKNEEYREMKLYWKKRLINKEGDRKEFDYIIFKNGYRKDSPKMKVEWKGLTSRMFNGDLCYAIKLGKIIQ